MSNQNKNIIEDDGPEELYKTEEEREKDMLSSSDALKIKNYLKAIRDYSKNILEILESKEKDSPIIFDRRGGGVIEPAEKEDGEVIEGVFDGQNMIGPDGKVYSIPANYASKSKLVEGDIMKLTITRRGSFIFKQISPVERERLLGKLYKKENADEFYVVAEDKKYRILKASVTYFKGREGEDVALLVPKDKSSTWAAVENVIKME